MTNPSQHYKRRREKILQIKNKHSKHKSLINQQDRNQLLSQIYLKMRKKVVGQG